MKKKFILPVIVLLILALLPAASLAAANSEITSYDVDIRVNENNTYDITEHLVQDYFPSPPTHGMYEVINLEPRVTMETKEGIVSKDYRVIVSNVRVDAPYETSVEDGRLWIRIGDENQYVNGQQVPYEISYTYDAGDDGFDAFDMFYYGIIGNTWEVPISNVTFRIEMPKEFDASKLGFSVGSTGASGYDADTLHYEVQGNVITGSYEGTLNPGEGIWARMELPQGYFQNMRQPNSGVVGFVVTFAVITALVFVLFLVFRRKKKPVQTVEFYPPEGMTSADVGYIIDGIVEDKDVISLLIYWADKGYMEIHEGEKKKDMIFKKVGDLPDSANDYETLMWNRLFESGDTVSTKSLQYNFYNTISSTKTRIKNKFETGENRVFKKSSEALRDLVCMLAAFPVAAMAALTVYANTYEIFPAILLGAFVFVFGYILVSMFVKLVNRWQSEKVSAKAGTFIVWVILTAAFYALVMFLCFDIFAGMIWFAPLCAILMTLMAPFFRRRTEQGLLWEGRILGLKHFINTVEKKKLEMMVEEDPAYFYSVLPYAYVLGVSDKWAKQFESIAVEPPSWYYGSGWSTFTTVYFTSALMSSMVRSQAMMAARAASSSGGGFSGGGGGFSGGGFSGGGFGGSGGGTW